MGEGEGDLICVQLIRVSSQSYTKIEKRNARWAGCGLRTFVEDPALLLLLLLKQMSQFVNAKCLLTNRVKYTLAFSKWKRYKMWD